MNEYERKIISDIGMTLEVMEDYMIDKRYIQVKKHFYHIKRQLGNLLPTVCEEPKVEFNKAIGNKIKSMRQDAEMTQSALGVKLGISHAAISDIENGKTKVTLETAYILRTIFNFEIADLLK